MAIARVQDAVVATDAASTPRTLAFGSNVTAGNFLIVVVAMDVVTQAGPIVSDSQANRWEFINNHPTGVGNQQTWIFFCRNAKTTGPCTVTVDPGTSTRLAIALGEYSGVSQISPIDSWVSQSGNGSGTTGTAGMLKVMRAGTGIFVGATFLSFGATVSAGAGFTLRQQADNGGDHHNGVFTEDMFGVSVDTDCPFSFAGGGLGGDCNYDAIAIALRPAYTPTSSIQAVPGQAATFQYHSPTTNNWGTTPLVCTYPMATTSGNLLTLCVATDNGNANPLTTTVTDNKGNTWVSVTDSSASASSGQRVEIWKVANCIGGNNHVVTITPTSTVYIAAVLNEYTGSGGLVDLTDNSSATDTAPTTNSFATTAKNLTLAVVGINATLGTPTYGNFSEDLGFNTGDTWTCVGLATGDSQQSMGIEVISFGDVTDDPGSTLTGTWALSASRFWVTTSVSFKFTPAPGPAPACMGEDSMILDPNTAFVREFAIGTTGLTINIQLSKAGGGVADPHVGSSNLTEIARGLYKFALAVEDTDTEGSLGYALTDAATNLVIYGHVVDRVVSIPKQIFETTSIDHPDYFTIPFSYGALFQMGLVIPSTIDLIPLPDMAEPASPPESDAHLIDGLSWIFHLCVTGRNETESLQDIFGRSSPTTVIAHSTQSDDGTTYVHGPYLS